MSTYDTPNQHAQKIIKHLEGILSSGHRPSQIFEDFLSIALISMEALPRHAEAIAKTGKTADDTPEAKAEFERIWQRYDFKTYQPKFASALSQLILATEQGIKDREYYDIIGDIYMAWGWPNKFQGQFFTPYTIARLMAQLTIPDAEQMVHQRLKDAINESPLAQAALLAGMIIEDPAEALRWYLEKVLPPAMPYYKPVTVSDCACGSGVMLLAAATLFPAWMVQMGLVQFYGQDIDGACVQMARLNILLYGLNGNGAKWAICLAGLDQLTPPPAAEIEIPIPVVIPAPARQLSLFGVHAVVDPALGTGAYLASLANPPYQEQE